MVGRVGGVVFTDSMAVVVAAVATGNSVGTGSLAGIPGMSYQSCCPLSINSGVFV